MGKLIEFRREQRRRKPLAHPAPAPRPTEIRDDPGALHLILPLAATKIVTFRGERELARYRARLYAVNGQGQFRYRTLRDEISAYGLVIWRMK